MAKRPHSPVAFPHPLAYDNPSDKHIWRVQPDSVWGGDCGREKEERGLEGRELLKKVVAGGTLAGSVQGFAGEELCGAARKGAGAEKPTSGTLQLHSSAKEGQGVVGASAGNRITFPRTFSGRNLKMIAFPLGGTGTGTIWLGGPGQLRDWEIFNWQDKGNTLDYCFPAIWVQAPPPPGPLPQGGEGRVIRTHLFSKPTPLCRPGDRGAGGRRSQHCKASSVTGH
jgi:hypothetical protein